MSTDNEESFISRETALWDLSNFGSDETETKSITTDSQVTITTSTTVETKEIRKVPVTKAVNFPQYVREKFALNLEPDIEINVGDQIIKCQRSVLELYSGYMRQLKCRKSFLELPDEKVTADAIRCIYEWMCNGQYKLKRMTVLEVHAAAKFLEIDSIIDQSWQCITAPTLVEDRAFMLYLEAIFLELPAVQKTMISRVQKFFLTLAGFMQFVELPFGHVCEMLSSDRLGVNSELEVFYACVRYLNFHWEDRKDRVFEMLKNIRFGLMPSHVLVSFRFKKESPEINRLLENAYVEKLLSQTMQEREWIYDFECDYHSTASIPGRKRLTYEKFLEYIRFLAERETHWMSYESMHDVEEAAQLMGV